MIQYSTKKSLTKMKSTTPSSHATSHTAMLLSHEHFKKNIWIYTAHTSMASWESAMHTTLPGMWIIQVFNINTTIILSLLHFITQNFIGQVNILENNLGLLLLLLTLTGLSIGMKFQRHLAITFLYLILRRITRYAQNLIKILLLQPLNLHLRLMYLTLELLNLLIISRRALLSRRCTLPFHELHCLFEILYGAPTIAFGAGFEIDICIPPSGVYLDVFIIDP
mmetsp:Transcript_23954/g.35605  ORF Transcript_23954/g.35605 Transcript_23954/m.35605 type:complete len:223 (+) Transcript_23954:284-952(+)